MLKISQFLSVLLLSALLLTASTAKADRVRFFGVWIICIQAIGLKLH